MAKRFEPRKFRRLVHRLVKNHPQQGQLMLYILLGVLNHSGIGIEVMQETLDRFNHQLEIGEQEETLF